MPIPERLGRFLNGTAFAGADIVPLAGDASARRYYRVRAPDGQRAVLMDGPHEMLSNFADITTRLQRAGYSAPDILHLDATEGLLLGEDLGDDLFARIIESQPAEHDLYCTAVDLLADITTRPDLAAGLPPYDMDFYLIETDILLDWYIPCATGARVTDALRATFRGYVKDALGQLSPAAPVCVLRDFHAENLIWLPDRQGVARVGLLDYQDALCGHPVYDIVSLLLDARRDVRESVIAEACTRFVAALDLDRAQFDADFALLGLHRNLKILGIFARLCARDGKPGYLAHLPRVWSLVQRTVGHDATGPLGELVQKVVPAPDHGVIERITAWDG